MGRKSRIKAQSRERETIGPFLRGWRHAWYLLLSRSEMIGLRNSTYDFKLGRSLGSYLPLFLGKDSGRMDSALFDLGRLDLTAFPPERLRRYPLSSISRIVVRTDWAAIDVHTIEGTCDHYSLVYRGLVVHNLKILKKLYSNSVPVEVRPEKTFIEE